MVEVRTRKQENGYRKAEYSVRDGMILRGIETGKVEHEPLKIMI